MSTPENLGSKCERRNLAFSEPVVGAPHVGALPGTEEGLGQAVHRDTRRERQSTPEQAAQGEPALQLEPAKKETSQNKVISPESPGEDRHIEDRDRRQDRVDVFF